MKGDLIETLKQYTDSGILKWFASSNPFEFYTYLDQIRYSIEQIYYFEDSLYYHVYEWNEVGDPILLDCFNNEDSQHRLSDLYNSILIKNIDYSKRYQEYKKRLTQEEQKKEQNRAVSLNKIMARLGVHPKEKNQFSNIIETEFFFYNKDDIEGTILRYVQPPLTQLQTVIGSTSLQDAQVVLISAPGATGKTAMAYYISNRLNIPIFDLGKCDAVGANSISGLLIKQLDLGIFYEFVQGLKSGVCSLIMDGLDEASIKITQDSFEAFLSDVAYYAKDSQGLPFVILGRPSVMEDASIILEDKGIKTTLLEIEPFTIANAKLFIDNQMNPDYVQRYDFHYRNVRDYIITQIGGFFKNESELNKKLFERFIGYAPVLQSISSLLNEKQNFHLLMDELQQSDKKKIDLLIDIVKRILNRERNKIFDEVLPQLFQKGRTEDFKTDIFNKSGNDEEQCRRILGIILNKEIIYRVSNDDYFDEIYNEKMNEWIKNHPFIKNDEKKIQNIVFESYLIATLIDIPDCKEDVLLYLNKTGSCSYLLLDIYTSLKKDSGGTIDYNFFPFLYSSFKTLDHPLDVGMTEILSDDEKVDPIKCNVFFSRDNVEYYFNFTIDDGESLVIPSPISAINIDANISVVLKDRKSDLQAPITIRCNEISIKSKEVLFSVPKQENAGIVWICDRFNAICPDGNFPNLLYRYLNKVHFEIITNAQLCYPFNEYRKNIPDYQRAEKVLLDIYAKFRRTILMFRTNRMGALIQSSGKINSRICKSTIGKIIIEKLIQENIFILSNDLYTINIDRFGEFFGVKYDDIRSSVINAKIKSFLLSVYEQIIRKQN